MRRFFRKLNHRDAVLRDLEALLVLYPPRRQFDRDFPALKVTIRTDFEAHVAPTLTALRIAQGVLDNFLDQLNAAEKAQALAALVERGRAGFSTIVERRVAGRRETPSDRAAFVAQLAGGAIYIAGRMAEEGVLRWDDYAEFLTRIETALGAGPEARQPLARAFSP
jgi:hypothetical protein